jgi:hypothetical protein
VSDLNIDALLEDIHSTLNELAGRDADDAVVDLATHLVTLTEIVRTVVSDVTPSPWQERKL